MKEWNLYKIKEKALESGRMVFSISELSNLLGLNYQSVKVYVSRLVEQGLATRLIRGKISFIDDDFIISTQLFEPSYISLYSALNYYHLIQQVPNFVYCVSTRNSRRYEELGIVYHKISPKLFFGYQTQKKEGSYFFIAELEKALLDGMYLGIFKESLIKEVRSKLDKQKLLMYSLKYPVIIKKRLNEVIK